MYIHGSNLRVHLQIGATNQSEESETMSPAMDLMNQMGMQTMLSALSNAAGLPIRTYILYKDYNLCFKCTGITVIRSRDQHK